MKFSKWHIAPAEEADIRRLGEAGYPQLVSQVLAARGISTAEEAAAFLERGRDLYEKAGVSDINQTKGWIGHSIGLNVHEYPCLEAGEDTPLQAGMVMSMEPSLTTPTAGTMCLEQNFIVTETGYELLSKMPTELVRVY